MTELESQSYRFGSHTLEARERRLLANGVAIPLKPRAFDTLLYLVERAGHLVPKEELLARLWPDSVVEESTLAKNVWLIRRALAEIDGEAPFIETVPRIGYRFIAPVERLAVEPAAPPSGPSPAVSRSLRLGAVAAVLGLLAFLAVGAFTGRVHPRSSPGTSGSAGPPPRASIAVLGFANLSRRSDSAWLSTALAEMMSADLAAGERLRLVPGADAMRLARTLPPAPGVLTREALAAARWQLAADYVVQGSYLSLPGPEGEVLRLDVVLQSTASGDTLCTVSGTGASNRLFALVDTAAARLRARLGLEPPAPQAAAAAAAAFPARPEAARLYAEGLEKLRQYDALGARPLLERAIALEERFPLAHVALSQALAALGYDPLAIAEAKRARALSGPLSRAQQLEIAAGLAEAQKDWTTAATTDRSLLAFFPDNLEYGLSLARTLTAGGKAAEALAVIAALRRHPRPASEDPRLDLAEAAASGALSDWPRELASARRAAAAARSRHLGLLLGEALLDEAAAESNLGQAQPAQGARLEAAHLFHDLGDTNAEAGALLGIANARGDHGDYDGAITGYRQVLATFERTGNRQGVAHAWSDIANTSWMEGNVEESLRSAEKGLALSREINDRRGIVWGLGAIGNALADQGEIEKALRMQTEGLAISREIGDRGYTAFCLGSLADTHFAAGDLETAYQGYRDALELSRSLHDAGGVARHEDDLATVLLAEGRLDEADHLFQGTLAARLRLGDEDAAAQTRMNLALVRTEQGHPAEGLALARQSTQAFTAMHQSGNTALALAAGALAEVALHQNAAAAADCERARTVLQGNRQNQPNLFVLLAQARVEIAGGHLAGARSLAEAARARAEKARSLASVFEARLVLGEIDLREHPQADIGMKRLQALAREAKAKSFLLIARKAEGLVAGAQTALRTASSLRPLE
ncbi:MAG TPA: tetratricopeptide repeat protein [Thermoanaerobaculia bacterium]|nr:tetratricopeptide repeat protein [Thermoanaerobaculia bacterium]